MIKFKKAVVAVLSVALLASAGANVVTPVLAADTAERQEASVSDFKDVASSKYYYYAVQYAVENGIVYGTTDTTFSPNASITRGQVAAILYRAAGSPKVTAKSPYSDVKSTKYYNNATIWLYEQGIAVGTVKKNGTRVFNPEEPIQRQELAKMLYQFAQFEEKDVTKSEDISSFSDASQASSYAVKYLKWTLAEGIMAGSTTKTGKKVLNPKGNATRGEVVTMVLRYYGTPVITQEDLLLGAGETVEVQATVDPVSQQAAGFTYESSDEKVFTVSEDGVVTGVANGTAELKITVNNSSNSYATVNVTVGYPAATKITFVNKDEQTTSLDTTLSWKSGADVVADIEKFGEYYKEFDGKTFKFEMNGETYTAQYTTADGVTVQKLVVGKEVDVTEHVRNSTDYEVNGLTVTLVDSELGDYVDALFDITAYAGESFDSELTFGETTITDVHVAGTYFISGTINGTEHKFYEIDGTLYVVGDVTNNADFQKLVDRGEVTLEYVEAPAKEAE